MKYSLSITSISLIMTNITYFSAYKASWNLPKYRIYSSHWNIFDLGRLARKEKKSCCVQYTKYDNHHILASNTSKLLGITIDICIQLSNIRIHNNILHTIFSHSHYYVLMYLQTLLNILKSSSKSWRGLYTNWWFILDN